MSTNFRNVRHPYLTSAIVHLVDVPHHVQWAYLEPVLERCGHVVSAVRYTAGDTGVDGRRGFEITFEQIYHAEIALATLPGIQVPGTKPKWNIDLSYSRDWEKLESSNPVYPQFVKLQLPSRDHVLKNASAQEVFRWFRNAGPLVSVKVNVDVGYRGMRTCVVQYFEEEHARFAQAKGGMIHSALRLDPPFSLRTFVPTEVVVFNLGLSFKQANIGTTFGKFGKMTTARLVQQGTANCQCYITFSSKMSAEHALRVINGKSDAPAKMLMRFVEPGQAVFSAPTPKERDDSSDESGYDTVAESDDGHTDERKPSASQKQDTRHEGPRKQDEEQRKNQDKLRLQEQRLAEARVGMVAAEQALQDHIQKSEKAASQRAELQRMERARDEDWLRVQEEQRSVEESSRRAERVHSEQAAVWLKATQAVREAERVLATAKRAEEKAKQDMADADREKAKVAEEVEAVTNRVPGVKLRREQIQSQVIDAEQEEQRLKVEGEELRRRQQVAEAILKMAELAWEEERDKAGKAQEAKAEQERIDEEQRARERRARENEERMTRENEERRAREEQERQAFEERRRQEAYKEAVAREEARCRKRDLAFSSWFGWSQSQAISRFRAVSVEFDTLDFCAAQPLTFGSVPWPILLSPKSVTSEQIQWDVVEKFFEVRRFHPDRWSSRGLLDTVVDGQRREQLAAAGNVVAQAMTPIWRQSHS